MPESDQPTRAPIARLIAGWVVLLAGCALAVWSSIPAVQQARRVDFEISALPADWLAGCLLLVVAGVLCALAGAGVVRGRWWIAGGRALVAVLAGYAGARVRTPLLVVSLARDTLMPLIRTPLRTLTRWLRTMACSTGRAGVDFIYNRACPWCRRERPEDDSLERGWPRLCRPCAAELAPPLEFACFRCGAPAGPYLDTTDGCAHCQDEPFAFERAVTLGAYDEALRRACLTIKQTGREPLAAALAHLLWQRSASAIGQFQADVVVAIPHHWRDRLSRGHNPAETLAGVLASRLSLRFARSCLRKVRHTPSQTSLDATQRRANLRGAFQAKQSRRLAGRRVLLVDDVLTTGTTAHRAARELRNAGASGVVVAVIARGLGRGRS